MRFITRKNYIAASIAVTFLFTLISLLTIPSTEGSVSPLSGRPFFSFAKRPIMIDDFALRVNDEGYLLYSTGAHGAYRYGPSIMRHEDGSLDAWYASPGNNSTEWDWIRYRHSDDGGETWSSEQIVMRPTPGSQDSCSVCDPGVIYFDGWYYMGYTGTDDAGRKGYNNSAFVARSRDPAGPFEKWNGDGWGGWPKPLIAYEGNPWGWGIGEISFVVKDDRLYVYYTYFDDHGGYTSLATAPVSEDWPSQLKEVGAVCGMTTQDSLDVAYDEHSDRFLGFSIKDRMSGSSQLVLYRSTDGVSGFIEADDDASYIEAYAHNLGIAKDEKGHISSADRQLIGYAYGRSWGRWSLKFQQFDIAYSTHAE